MILLDSKINNMKSILPLALLIVLLQSCGGGKKVVVMASGKVSAEGTVITLEPGTQHNELPIMVSGDKVTVKNGSASTDYPVTESGIYILNLKNDTLVGSYQRVGEGAGQQSISQEGLAKSIDSLQQLMAGTNVSAAARNYNIAPGKLAKVSSNTASDIIGPFVKMPSSFEGGKEYEIYKFFTNKEVAETVEKLKKLQ